MCCKICSLCIEVMINELLEDNYSEAENYIFKAKQFTEPVSASWENKPY